MTIPSSITTALTSLEAQVLAATPLNKASSPTILALQLNSQALTDQIETAQYTLAGQIDTWVAPADPEGMISGALQIYNSAVDEASISELRGVLGRVTANLDQLPSG